jgi:hypothetical protein
LGWANKKGSIVKVNPKSWNNIFLVSRLGLETPFPKTLSSPPFCFASWGNTRRVPSLARGSLTPPPTPHVVFLCLIVVPLFFPFKCSLCYSCPCWSSCYFCSCWSFCSSLPSWSLCFFLHWCLDVPCVFLCLVNPFVGLINCIIVCAFAFVTIYELLKYCNITLIIFPFTINIYMCMKVLQFTSHPCFKRKLI